MTIVRQIREILLTYIRRVLSGPLALFMLLIPLVAVLQLLFMPLRLFSTGFMIFYFPGLVAVHLKQQAIHIRERRLPSALNLHLAVGVALVLLLALGLPIARMSITHQWSVGFPGLILTGTAITFAIIMIGSAVFGILLVPFIWIGFVPSAQQWIADLCTGYHEEVGIALVACGLAGIWASIALLRELTEEDRAYHWRTDAASQGTYQRLTGQRMQTAALVYRKGRWFNPPDPAEKAIAKWPALSQGTFWQVARLWAISSRLPIGTLSVCLLFPLLSVAPAWLSGRPFSLQQLPSPLYLGFVNIVAAAAWFQRRSLWAAESMRPISRRGFIIIQGLSLAHSMTLVALLFIAGWLSIIAAYSPPLLLEAATWRMVLATVAGQALIYGACTWLLRYQTGAALGAGILVAMVCVSSVAGVFSSGPSALDIQSMSVALALSVAISALITWDAYRRWLNTELG